MNPETLRAILDATADAIVGIDERGVITFWNATATRRFGWPAAEILGRNISVLMTSPHSEAHDAYLARYLATGEKRIIDTEREVEARHRDGRPFPIALRVTELRLDGRRMFIGIAQDITARRRLEEEVRRHREQLHQAQKMEAIGQLAAGVAHDFNNLLTAVTGYASMLKERVGAEHEETLREILLASGRAAALTRQLLAFARRQRLQIHVLDPNAIVLALAPLLRRLIGERIEIQTRLSPCAGGVRADEVQLEQVLLNLAINARDAMPHGGRLTIETSAAEFDAEYARTHADVAPGRYVLISVTDTGAGMDSETLGHVFEPFFTTKESGQGTGLGLATVFGVVKQSGGHIAVYSEPGRGTAFKVYLPQTDAPSPQATAPPESPPRPLHGRERVMVVEDDCHIRELLVKMLGAHGYQVVAACDGEDALRICSSSPMDLVLTDLVMPGLTGLRLYDRLRQLPVPPRVVFMSGYTNETSRQQGELPPEVPFLAKPFTLVTALRRVRDALDAGASPAPQA